MPTDAEKYRILSRYLPSDVILDDKLTYCHINRAEQTQLIDKFRKALVAEKIIIDQPSYLYKNECLLEPEWNGTFDFLDKESDEKATFTKPSIGWTCQPIECHIEADLPVPETAEYSLKKDLENIGNCCITEIHEHGEIHTREKTPEGYKLAFAPEKHLHVICKGVHPNDLGHTVNQLTRAVLKNRGHKMPTL